jgi:hypothetical protein
VDCNFATDCNLYLIEQFDIRHFIPSATWKLETRRTPDGGGLAFWLNFVSFGDRFRPEGMAMMTVECELSVRQKEGQTVDGSMCLP